MKKQVVIILLFIISISCVDKKQKDVNKLIGDESVTFIIKSLPKAHNFDNDIYISGGFEGWSGGKEQFKLKKEKKQYSITIPKHQESFSFKFTQGNWGTVECDFDGNPIENRTYNFAKKAETVEISIPNWNSKRRQNKPSTAAENVAIFSDNFDIPQLNRERKVSIYLPPNYNVSEEKHPVLYILDGQNVFDISTSYSGEWEVDETLNRIFDKTGFGLIVVAIDHGGDKRLNEYSAWDNEKYGKGEGALYLDFLVNTLKPEIDKAYRTKSESENTIIMGSSLGGLFSHYAAIKKPDIFGKAGVFSPSFWYAKESFNFTKNATGLDASKLYYLVGEKEGNDMVKPMHDMVVLLKNKTNNENNIYEKVVSNGTHSESFWKSEFENAIIWLFNLNEQ